MATQKQIQWYPGHMAKAKREMTDKLKLCDVVAEIVDARIPAASRNPDIDQLAGGKPRVIILNRADQADPSQTRRWRERLSANATILETDCKSGNGVAKFAEAVRLAAREKLERAAEKGQTPVIRAMVAGVPNVGKSSFINRVSGNKKAKAEDRPGVTRSNQWFSVSRDLELLDTPGLLWPKFEDENTGLCLAFTGAIRDDIMDIETLAGRLLERLTGRYLAALTQRYGITAAEDIYAMLERAGRRRGCMISGGEVDLARAATLVLDDFRAGRLGRITLETVDDERS